MNEKLIIETRYRDVDFDEVRKCITYPSNATEWDKWRGQPVQIETPALPAGGEVRYRCVRGPHFRIATHLVDYQVVIVWTRRRDWRLVQRTFQWEYYVSLPGNTDGVVLRHADT